MPEVGQWSESFTDRRGNAIANVTVTVYEDDGTTLATLYADQSGTTLLANPLPTGVPAGDGGVDALANGSFFAVPGPYVLAVERPLGTEIYRAPIIVAVDTTVAGVTDHGALSGLGDPDHPIGAVVGLQAALDADDAALAAEVAARVADVDAEEAARIAAVSAEATTRGNADTALSVAIASEVTARAADVDAEEAARIAADVAHAADTSSVHGFADTVVVEAKVGHLTVTQPVDLDAIEARVNSLDAAVVLRGSWDASAGTFPGGGTAQAGDSWVVSVGGTVNGVVFNVGDRVIAIVDNASTVTFAGDWFKADYTDQVLSVDGRTGAVTLSDLYQPLSGDLSVIDAANNGAVLAATTASFLTADETKLDGIETGATADQTAAEILAALLTVDGSGSGLDADLLDGLSSAAFETPAGAQAKADAKVTQTIRDGVTATAPSENAVSDALVLLGEQIVSTVHPIPAFRASASTSSEIGIIRSGSNYKLIQHLGSGRWAAIDFNNVVIGSYAINAIGPGVRIEQPLLSIALGDASIVRTGAGWSLSGDYRTVTTGNYFVFTTPASATKIGWTTVEAVNGGLSKVEIDGDATRATLLKTAQDLVTAGTFPNTILVANGGTLNPTDRVWDAYGASGTAKSVLCADDLTAGVHTLKVTCTGYKRAASSDFRLQQAACYYALAATTPATASITMIAGPFDILKDPSVSTWEYALAWWPSGGANKNLKGNTAHGYDDQQTLTFTMDGAAITPANPSTTIGTTLIVTRTSIWRTPDLVAPNDNMATCTVVYQLNAAGLKVDWSAVWARAGAVDLSYAAMMPVGGATSPLKRGTTFGFGSNVDLTLNNAAVQCDVGSPGIGWIWDPAGRYAMLMALVTLEGVDSFRFSGADRFYIEDRVDGLEKIYARRRPAAGETVAVGDIWRSSTLYLFGRFTDTNATLGEHPQGAGVADATGGLMIDAEARVALNALISRIEASGLIATV